MNTATLLAKQDATNRGEDESQLVIRACRRSMSTFEALIDLYEPRINRVLYGLAQDVQLAQDLCQETFLAAYRALPCMQGEQLHFAPWLYRIAVNQARSEWRRRKHVTTIPLALKTRYDEESGDEYAGEWLVYPHRFEDDIVERDLVRRVLAQLPTSSVACLLLDVEGFSYGEIAEILHESLSAIRSRLSRARKKFQHL